MPQTYFSNFTTLNYGSANTPAVDLTERIVQQQTQLYNPNIFYPLDIGDGTRADMIAQNVWGDPFTSWILYLTNNIIDPYYDYFLTQEQFYNFIVLKYGSIVAAQQQILYWQTDWTNAQPISIAGFLALDANQSKYWTPNYGNSSFIINYVRKQQLLTVTTDYVLNLTITGNTVAFVENEPLSISYVPGSNGSAQSVVANATNLIVQHGLNDAFPAPSNPNSSVVIANTSFVYGIKSGANATITAVSFVSNNIPIDEVIYWSPVYAYDYETAKNQGNRIVNVLQPNYAPSFVAKTANLLSQVVR